jgi:SAM-dependent methyltransferase
MLEPNDPAEFKLQVRRIFDESADFYQRERESQPGFRRQAAWLLATAGAAEGARVLEVGCGAGSLVSQLAAAGYRYFGCDLSLRMAVGAVRRAEAAHVAHGIACADAEALPFRKGSVDLVIAVGVLEYLPSPLRFLEEAARVLRRGGRLLLSVPSSVSPHALAGAAFDSLPNRLRALLLRRDPRAPLPSFRSRPVRAAGLRRALVQVGLEPGRCRFTHFVFFPLDRLWPRASDALASALEPMGGVPVASRLGAQILLEAVRGSAPATASQAATRRAGSQTAA